MRVRQAITLEDLDPAPVLGFFPALLAEWQALQFVGGVLQHPGDPGAVVNTLELVSGTHGRSGAHYVAFSGSDPDGGQTAFDFEVERTRRGGLKFTGASRNQDASGRATVRLRPAPIVDGSFDADLSALSGDELELGGCLGWLFGGRARVAGDADANALGNGGTFLNAKGRINRFPFRLQVDVRHPGPQPELKATIVVRAKGVAR